mmetsp:Transcript_32868/g.59632  ORF Transcript_32868/g.59632 Transcript_32868/m.59632 type:complete len:267 (-) Transcript_32868:92-892(-)|eukprot:CAMPEP_0197652076 /NCGR_PEP_ID=MMETSP1338-20131121/34229_1 /TAXON_ID=43686 ORGANISM="Pelagodinium beii, Strain RCC1491" /NCGR_SAMPLE_ID=MMETSP1338 /ASSEMBLY_ACC=CAM_ASM_000754 /LENGTH=266 /DNA_ID=CAMNT_0043226873 /DNA_START=81 /DNA_END=881 /DNA_ORIENTATION=-
MTFGAWCAILPLPFIQAAIYKTAALHQPVLPTGLSLGRPKTAAIQTPAATIRRERVSREVKEALEEDPELESFGKPHKFARKELAQLQAGEGQSWQAERKSLLHDVRYTKLREPRVIASSNDTAYKAGVRPDGTFVWSPVMEHHPDAWIMFDFHRPVRIDGVNINSWWRDRFPSGFSMQTAFTPSPKGWFPTAWAGDCWCPPYNPPANVQKNTDPTRVDTLDDCSVRSSVPAVSRYVRMKFDATCGALTLDVSNITFWQIAMKHEL